MILLLIAALLFDSGHLLAALAIAIMELFVLILFRTKLSYYFMKALPDISFLIIVMCSVLFPKYRPSNFVC